MTGASALETRIRVIYPRQEQSIYEDSTFLLGQVSGLPPGGWLEVSGDRIPQARIPLSRQGFFAWKIPLREGMNPVRLQVRANQASPPTSEALFALYRVPPLDIPPALPLTLHEETLQPDGDLWLRPEDVLTVACSASIGAEVSLNAPGLNVSPVMLHPLSSDAPFLDTREVIFAQPHWTRRRIPVKGYYQAQVRISDWLSESETKEPAPENQPLILQIRHGQIRHGQLRHGEARLERALPGRLTVLRKPRTAIIREDRAVTRTAPVQGARLTPQRVGTQIAVDGLEQGWARARLSRESCFYLPLESLSFPAETLPIPALRLSHIETERLSDHTGLVKLAFSHPPLHACPVQVETPPMAVSPSNGTARTNRISARLYGVRSCCDFIRYPADDALIRQIHWRQVSEDVLEVWIDLRRPLSGWDMAWQDGEWRFLLKSLPPRLEDIRVLIDPGHGGAESGATGPNGLPEKTLNLAVSQCLRDALLREGFQHVTMTRHSDQEVSLPARGAQVIADATDIVLSIHHNALPDGRDPLQAQGACTFYYHPFSKPLAEALLNGLTGKDGNPNFDIPNYGLFYDSLFMTRIHQALAVLVEIGFFTFPDEFERLIEPDFQREAAQRLASTVRRYCFLQQAN